MTERTAVHYGKVELIPGIVCDDYVLDDGTAVLSERGTADLLDMDHKALQRMATNWPPKTLQIFADQSDSMATNLVEVVATNSPYRHKKIIVYATSSIQALIYTYASAFIKNGLRKNQIHIGERAVALSISLVKTALDAAIKQACGLPTNIQQTAQQHYIDVVKLVKEHGFKCSIPNDIAIKKDIAQFLDIPESTLDSFLRKHKDEIVPIKLDRATIRAAGYKASAMNGYHIDDVTKVVLGMDSVMEIV